MPMRPVETARYFSKVSAFMLICVALHSLHVSVTSTTKGALDWHGGACSTNLLSQFEQTKVSVYCHHDSLGAT